MCETESKMTELTVISYIIYDDMFERSCTVNSATSSFEDALRSAWHKRLIEVNLCNVENLNDHCECVSCWKSFYATYVK